MSEILFRAKTTSKGGTHEFNNVWVEGDLITSGSKYYIHPKNNRIRVEGELGKLIIMHEVVPETVGQFTGLYTVNKKKIFDGDIVKYDEKLFVVQREDETPGGSWSCTAYILQEVGSSGGLSFEDTIDEYCNEICVEIIGNIHDDPKFCAQRA